MTSDRWLLYGEARKPKAIADESWRRIGNDVQAVVDQLDLDSSFFRLPYNTVSVISKVLDSYPRLTAQEAFTFPNIDALALNGSLSGWETYLAMEIARTLNPSNIDMGPRLTNSPAAQPYSRHEITRIEDWANYKQRSGLLAAKKLVVSLGLGAGLTGKEMGALRWNQVHIDSQGIVLSDVSGRDVPVLRRFDTALRDYAPSSVDQADSFVLLPNYSRRTTLTGNVFSNSAEEGLCPTVLRMRDTWLLHHVAADVPWSMIRYVAGGVNEPKLLALASMAEPIDIWRVRGVFHEKPQTGLRVV